jgi:drug/metabolite transporter (DMT)-like permease|tara:strand:+ start:696 stop:1640 length:945 start_codon:yes stop_codon:yes gene_type:complete
MLDFSTRKLATTNLLMLTVAVLWGLAWPVGRILATDLLDFPFTVMFLRYTFAVPILFAWMWIKEGNIVPKAADRRVLFVMAFTSVFLYQIGYMYGMQRTAASDASLVIGFNPIFVAILSFVVLSHKLTTKSLLGMGLSFIGILLIFIASPNVDIPVKERLIGNSLIMFGAFAYAIYIIVMRIYVLESKGDQLSSLSLIAWVSLIGWILFIPFTFLESPWERSWSTDEWLLIGYLGSLSTALSYVFFAIGIEVIGANRASSFVNVVPIFGILSSWLWINEKLGWIQLVSFGLIYFGVRMVNTQPPEVKIEKEPYI